MVSSSRLSPTTSTPPLPLAAFAGAAARRARTSSAACAATKASLRTPAIGRFLHYADALRPSGDNRRIAGPGADPARLRRRGNGGCGRGEGGDEQGGGCSERGGSWGERYEGKGPAGGQTVRPAARRLLRLDRIARQHARRRPELRRLPRRGEQRPRHLRKRPGRPPADRLPGPRRRPAEQALNAYIHAAN